MKQNMRQWMTDIIQRKEVTALPVMTHPGIEMNGNTVRQAVSNGRVHYDKALSCGSCGYHYGPDY